MSIENNIEKIIGRQKEIENILVNSIELKPSELADLSKELSEIKLITDLANKKDVLVKEILDLSEIINDKNADEDIKDIATNEFHSLKEDINNDQTGQSKAQWLRFEDALYKERLNKKYLTAVSKGLNVSDLHAEINYKEKGEVRNVSYIDISFRTISDSLIDINDSELVDFMKLNETDYQQKKSRSIEYVIFPVIPSDSDKKRNKSIWLKK